MNLETYCQKTGLDYVKTQARLKYTHRQFADLSPLAIIVRMGVRTIKDKPRAWDCKHYGECMQYAAKKDLWNTKPGEPLPKTTCHKKCPCYEHAELSMDLAIDEYPRLLMLLGVAFGEGKMPKVTKTKQKKGNKK